MSLFNFFRKPATVPLHFLEVRDRARLIHERVGHREVAIADLFAMVGEDESIVRRREIRQALSENSDLPRFLPGDIPTTGNTQNWQD